MNEGRRTWQYTEHERQFELEPGDEKKRMAAFVLSAGRAPKGVVGKIHELVDRVEDDKAEGTGIFYRLGWVMDGC